MKVLTSKNETPILKLMSKKLLFTLVILASFLLLTSFSPRQSFALDCSNFDSLNVLQKAVCNPLGTVMNTALGLTEEHLSKFIVEVFSGATETIFLVLVGEPVAGPGPVSYQYQGGLASTIGTAMFAVVSSPPTVNHFAFAKHTLANNMFGQPVYAETGSSYLNPISGLWEKFRNVAYGLFVVAIALVALGLMMRTQISPRVTITLANSLPRLFLALFLITFSFPIVGVLIDLAAVLKGLIDNVMLGSTVADWTTSFVVGGAMVQTIIGNSIDFVKTFAMMAGVAAPAGAIIGLLIAILLAIAVLITFIKLFFIIIIRWAGIFVAVILSPLALFWSAIPGQEASAIKLFKSLLVNVLTFPVIYFLILLAVEVGSQKIGVISAPDTIGWTPFTAALNLADPRIVGFSINGFVSLGILFTATKVPEVLEDALNLRPIFKGGGGPAEVLGKIPIVGGLMK